MKLNELFFVIDEIAKDLSTMQGAGSPEHEYDEEFKRLLERGLREEYSETYIQDIMSRYKRKDRKVVYGEIYSC